MSSHFDIWLSNEPVHLTITPVDKGYDLMEEIMTMLEKAGYDIGEIINHVNGEYWFKLDLEKVDG